MKLMVTIKISAAIVLNVDLHGAAFCFDGTKGEKLVLLVNKNSHRNISDDTLYNNFSIWGWLTKKGWYIFSRLASFILSWRIMDTSQFQTKVYFIAHSDKNFLELEDLCVLLHSQVGCTNEECEIRNFANLLSAFFDKLDKNV